MQFDHDNSLQSYFTDMEHLRGMFGGYVSAQSLPKRLFVIHGVGGAGKSSLLRMFRLHCKSEKIPVGLSSGDDAKSVLDVITRWAEDLQEDGIKFATLNKTLESYRAIQAKVEDQAKKTPNRMVDIASKAASKTAETAGGALLGAAIGSIIPGMGTAIGGALGGVISGMGAEALTDWLRGFLVKPDIELLLDPAKRLGADFLEDIAKAAAKKRMVLLLDTFEQMSALEDWVGEVGQEIHPNVLIVITGRKLPNWNRIWSDWMMNAQVEELKPMNEDIMRQLIRRYYATMRGGEPDPVQVDVIIRFARGLPMVVTSAVQLWVKYGVEDFQSVKAEIVANLVDRLMEGVPAALLPAFEAAAVVRWFDQPVLRAVMKQEDVRELYNELRRFPFVRTRVEGLALHDSVRDIVDENLRVQDSERHAELHERAAQYFEKRLEKVTGEEAERMRLERLYHRVRENEAGGIRLFQEIAEGLTRVRLINPLRALMSDVNTYPLEHENSRLWREYYNARVMQFKRQRQEAETILKAIGNNPNAEPKLQAYSLCDLGELLSTNNQNEEAIAEIYRGLAIIPLDSKLASSFVHLSFSLDQTGQYLESQVVLEKARDYHERTEDKYGLATVQNFLKNHFLGRGEPAKARAYLRSSLQTISTMHPKPLYLNYRVLETWAAPWTWYGDRYQAELRSNEAERIKANFDPEYFDESDYAGIGYILGMQDKFEEAEKWFNLAFNYMSRFNDHGAIHSSAIQQGDWGAILKRAGRMTEAEDILTRSLETKRKINDFPGFAELMVWLGELFEIRAFQEDRNVNLIKADALYAEAGSYSNYRPYFDIAALTGRVRVKYAMGDLTAIPPLIAFAEQIAQKNEFNDLLASLSLIRGHMEWKDLVRNKPSIPVPASDRGNLQIQQYQLAIIYALRYNRFMLDEILSGRPQGTPLPSIIPFCLERGAEGKQVLLTLLDWWKTGSNDVGTPRLDTISSIPEGIALIEAEKIAREQEPGNRATQKSVIEQIEAAIAN